MRIILFAPFHIPICNVGLLARDGRNRRRRRCRSEFWRAFRHHGLWNGKQDFQDKNSKLGENVRMVDSKRRCGFDDFQGKINSLALCLYANTASVARRFHQSTAQDQDLLPVDVDLHLPWSAH